MACATGGGGAHARPCHCRRLTPFSHPPWDALCPLRQGGASADGDEGDEPEVRRQLRARRAAEKHARMAAQLAEKRARDEAEAAEKAGKVEFREQLRPRIDAWCAGKKDNIRALLSSMHTVMWEGSGWVQPSMADMVDGNKVRVRVFVCACVRGACVRACVCGAAAVLGGGVADECDASAHPLHHYTTPAGQALLHEGQPGCSPRQGEPGRQAGRQRGACVGWAGHRARARLPPARRVHPRHPRTHPPTHALSPPQVKQKGGTLEQVATADMVFDVLKAAWNKFEAAGR